MEAEPFKGTIADYWDGRSGQFDQQQGIRNRPQERVWLGFLDLTVGSEAKTVLDVGTGTGFLALLLAEMGHQVKGLDLSPGMVDQARRLAEERGLTATFDTGDAESLPEADATYDVVINRNVLWTLPRPDKALADWKRVLKPGGRLVVVDGNWFDNPLSFRARRFLGHLLLSIIQRRSSRAAERRLRQGYDREFDPNLPLKAAGNRETFPRLIAEAGFTDVRLLDMPVVNKVERSHLRLARRLLQPYRFFAVIATRP